MKSPRLAPWFIAAAALVAVCLAPAQTGPTVSVDATRSAGAMPLVGYNFTWANANTALIAPNQGSSSATVAAFNDGTNGTVNVLAMVEGMAPGALRFPGGTCVNTFSWQDAIGPLNRRPAQAYGIGTDPASEVCLYGPDEAGRLAELVGAKTVAVVNPNATPAGEATVSAGGGPAGEAQSAANLVAYLIGTPSDSNTTDAYWVQQRIANGHAAPYAVPLWEVGNEEGSPQIKVWAQWPDIGDDPQDAEYIGTKKSQQFKTWQLSGGSRQFTQQQGVLVNDWNSADGEVAANTPNQQFYVKFPPVDTSHPITVHVANLVTFTDTTAGCGVTILYNPVPALVNDTAYTVTTSLSVLQSAGPSQALCYLNPSTGLIQFGSGNGTTGNGLMPPGSSGGEPNYVYVDYWSGPHDGYKSIHDAMQAVAQRSGTTIAVTLASSGVLPEYQNASGGGTFPLEGYEIHEGSAFGNETQPASGASPFLPVDFFNEAVGRGYFGYPTAMISGVSGMVANGLPLSVGINASEFSVGGALYKPSISATPAPYNRTIGGALTYALMACQRMQTFQWVGASGISQPMHPSDGVAGMTVGGAATAFPITTGTFTVNGRLITIGSNTETLPTVFSQVTSALGQKGAFSYATATDKVTVKSASAIVLGAAGDTSNFLYEMALLPVGTSTLTVASGTSSDRTLGRLDPTKPLNKTRLKLAVTTTGTLAVAGLTASGSALAYDPATQSLNDVLGGIQNATSTAYADYDVVNDRIVISACGVAWPEVHGVLSDSSGNLAQALNATSSAGATLNIGNDYPTTTFMADYLFTSSVNFNNQASGIDFMNSSGNLQFDLMSGTPVQSAMGYSLELLARDFGVTVLPSTVTAAGDTTILSWQPESQISPCGDVTATGTIPNVVVAASLDHSGNLCLLAVNPSQSSETVTIDVSGFDLAGSNNLTSYKLKSFGASLTSYNQPSLRSNVYIEDSSDSNTWVEGQTQSSILQDIAITNAGQTIQFTSPGATARVIKVGK